jgi:hypothetical protein
VKYKVREIYTPENEEADRSRQNFTFYSDSTDLVELAVQARIACHGRSVTPHIISPETEANIRRAIKESDVAGQLQDEDYDTGYFEFLLFGSDGEWLLKVEQL